MKTITLKGLLLVALFAGIFTSCTDDFTEEDALNKQQTIDLSIYVNDYFTKNGVGEASVSIVQDGQTISSMTNEIGVAFFEDVKIGGNIPVFIEKEGFTPVQTLVSVNVTNYREGQRTETVSIFSLTENTAIIKGKLEIETDLTNEDTEVVPENSIVKAYLSMNGVISDIEFSATVDANGNYEFVVPASKTGVTYELTYPTLVLDQTIAINGNEGDEDFPATLPSIATIPTTFNPIGSSVDVPSVPALVATVPVPAGGTRALIENYDIDVNGDGEIYNVYLRYERGEGYTDTSVPVTFTSLLGGSGVDAEFTVLSDGTLNSWATINETGSGYPTTNQANRAGQYGPSFDSNVYSLKTGEIRVVNGNYGTGTYREQDIK